MLHQFDLGLLKEVWKGIMKLIKAEATEAGNPGDFTRRHVFFKSLITCAQSYPLFEG
jgi:hypothetical protein